MSLIQLTQYNFKTTIRTKYRDLGTPLNTSKCNCEYCQIDPNGDMYINIGTVQRGWRKIIDSLLHDFSLLYDKSRGNYRIFFLSIVASERIQLEKLTVFNINNDKERFSKGTYAHILVRDANRAAAKTCTVCSKPAIGKFQLGAPLSPKVPRCKKHEKSPSVF